MRKDTTSVDVAVPDYEAALTGDIRGLKVGIPKEYRVDGMPSEIEELWTQGIEWLKAAGAEIVDVSLPHYQIRVCQLIISWHLPKPLPIWRVMTVSVMACGLRVMIFSICTRKPVSEGFGDEVQRRILIGTYVLSAGYYDAYYLKAQKIRTLIAQDFTSAFEKVDVLLTPSTPGTGIWYWRAYKRSVIDVSQ